MHNLTYEDLATSYAAILRDRGFHVDVINEEGITFSLTSLGLSTVYATITAEEIQYHFDMKD